MIISHKHKFIFIKPTKVAGTSVEINLAKHCGDQDIITPITEYATGNDSSFYLHNPRNFDGFYNHIPPDEIKRKIGDEIWNGYFKFSIIRNPWDIAVSRFCWNKKDDTNKFIKFFLKFFEKYDFKKFIENYPERWTNNKFYLDADGNKYCDFYVKYEHLESDYNKVCQFIGIPYEKLPKTKDRLRKYKGNYKSYYNKYLRDIIARKFKIEIEKFGYKFD
jgi:hypothetical protein